MMDDIQEQTELADEISRAISEPAGFGMDVDEVSVNNVTVWLPYPGHIDKVDQPDYRKITMHSEKVSSQL